MGLRMQKHGEIPADLAVTQTQHLCCGTSDNHPVALAHRQAEQRIADRTADEESVH
jgi:hypothetical protein